MRYRRADIVERAVDVLDQYGLADLSMRRIASELGLQPSALYHHFGNKQELLAAVADEVLQRGRHADHDRLAWEAAVSAISHELRDAMLAYRDGAELVATVQAFGLGTRSLVEPLAAAFSRGGLGDDLARAAAATVLHFVFGFVTEEQIHLQASSAGAIDDDRLVRPGAGSFDLGLSFIVDGARHRSEQAAST